MKQEIKTKREYKTIRLSKDVLKHLENNVINFSKWVELRYKEEFMKGL